MHRSQVGPRGGANVPSGYWEFEGETCSVNTECSI